MVPQDSLDFKVKHGHRKLVQAPEREMYPMTNKNALVQIIDFLQNLFVMVNFKVGLLLQERSMKNKSR